MFAGGVANAVHASKHAEAYSAAQWSCERGYEDDFCDNLKAARGSQAAAAVSCHTNSKNINVPKSCTS